MNTVQGENKLVKFLNSALPERLYATPGSGFEHIKTRENFIKDVLDGVALAPMAIRLTPHTLSVIDWCNPFDDPVRRQFLPMKSSTIDDHPMLELDSLHEEGDSKVKGLVHRYPDKALFLGESFSNEMTNLIPILLTVIVTSACPVYCRFCTRSYAIGPETNTVSKHPLKPTKKRWDEVFEYIENTPALQDIVVSGGDAYYLSPDQLYDIGKRLIEIPHIRRFRFASKGLAVCPARIIDPVDSWTAALIAVSNLGKAKGKAVALHTHFNHPNEITWVTKLAAQRLFKEGVTVRNQSVLLRGVNDNVATMSALIRKLADNNINPVSIPIVLYFIMCKLIFNVLSTTCIKATWSRASRTSVPPCRPSLTSKSRFAEPSLVS
jgi:lysine 2,3-aminomutase